MTFTVADVVLSLVLIIGVLLGACRGFFAVLSKPVKIIGALCITFCIASPIISSFSAPYFSEVFADKIEGLLLSDFPDIAAAGTIDVLPFYLRIVATLSDIDPTGLSAAEVIPYLAQSFGNAIGTFVAFIVTYFGLFIAISIILGVLISLLDKVISTGFIGVINRILGLALGGAVSVVLCCIVANIISLVSPEFVGGFVYTFFKDFNPLQLIQSINT